MDFATGLSERIAVSTMELCKLVAALKLALHFPVVEVLQPITTQRLGFLVDGVLFV